MKRGNWQVEFALSVLVAMVVMGAGGCQLSNQAEDLECGAGTVERDGECVVPVECGEGTVLEDGECVPAADTGGEPNGDGGSTADAGLDTGVDEDGGMDDTGVDVASDGGSDASSVGPVAVGRRHACAVDADGRVLCWGENDSKQLGRSSEAEMIPTPVEVSGISSAISVTAGSKHSCALLENGKVYCWGANQQGQLGNGSTSEEPVSEPVNVEGLSESVVAVRAGHRYTCALLESGEVSCWGFNTKGQLGNGSRSGQPVSSPVDVEGISSATSLTVGRLHGCVRLKEGTAKCWGDNQYGQVGKGSTSEQPVPSPVAVQNISSASSIAAGSGHTCATLEGGAVRCWGNNAFGQLGNGSSSEEPTPTPTEVSGLSEATAITAGTAHTCVRTSEGDAECWGANDKEQLGRPLPEEQQIDETPGAVTGLDSFVRLAADGRQTCALMSHTGSLKVHCWGSNGRGQLGSGGNYKGQAIPAPIADISSIADITHGGGHGCARLDDGTLHCWGNNEHAQLGIGSTSDSETKPFEVSGFSGVKSVAVGTSHTCAVLQGGGVRCWGANGDGQVGDGTTHQPDVPQKVPVEVQGISSAVSAVAGHSHTCALLESGEVRCWGYNFNGQLGHGEGDREEPAPVNVEGISTAEALSAGAHFTCALLESGEVRCWGTNKNGELGNGTTAPSEPGAGQTAPVAVENVDTAVAVDSGRDHTCALLTDGTVRCWGANTRGQVGDGSTSTSVSTPTKVLGISSAKGVAAGTHHSCVLLEDDTVRCWGENRDGQLGNKTLSRARPVTASPPVPGLTSPVTSIEAAGSNSCALLENGEGRCWGSKRDGRIGNGTFQDRDGQTTPVAVEF